MSGHYILYTVNCGRSECGHFMHDSWLVYAKTGQTRESCMAVISVLHVGSFLGPRRVGQIQSEASQADHRIY
jgi:hypothetical protein